MHVPCFRGHIVDKHGDVWGTVSDKHSSGLSFVQLLVTNRHIVSFKRHFGNNKQAHCMHIVRVTSRHIG